MHKAFLFDLSIDPSHEEQFVVLKLLSEVRQSAKVHGLDISEPNRGNVPNIAVAYCKFRNEWLSLLVIPSRHVAHTRIITCLFDFWSAWKPLLSYFHKNIHDKDNIVYFKNTLNNILILRPDVSNLRLVERVEGHRTISELE